MYAFAEQSLITPQGALGGVLIALVVLRDGGYLLSLGPSHGTLKS